MAVTLSTVKEFLDQMELKYDVREDDDYIITGFKTEHYLDKDGDKHLTVIIALLENGEYVKVLAPRAYSYKETEHLSALMKALLVMSYRTKLVQWEYDPSDGEVRAMIEFPLEDSTLTKKQLGRCIFGLVQLLDDYHDVFIHAVETGELDLNLEHNKQEEPSSQMQDLLETAVGELGEEGIVATLLEAMQRRKPDAKDGTGSSELPE